MFSTGHFRNFPIDDDVSIGSVTDLLSTTISHSITSFNTSATDWARDDMTRTRPHIQSLENVDEICTATTKRVDSFHIKNGHDLASSLTVVLSMPDLCDVTFLVGPSLAPIHGLRAVMATRSIILQALFISHENILGRSSPAKSTEKRGILSKLFKRKSKGRKPSERLIISLPEHEANVFSSFVTYLHTGTVSVNTTNLIGLLRLADLYKVDDLRNACWAFSERCMTSQAVVKLLTSVQQYSHCQSIAQLNDKLLAYVDRHPRQILTTPAFLSAPPSVATTILTRPHLPISENDRVSSMLSWSRHHHRHSPADLPVTVTKLLQCVNFSAISNPHIRSDVIQLGYVPTIDTTTPRNPSRSSTLKCRKKLFSVDRRHRVSSTLAKTHHDLQSLNRSRRESLNRTRRELELSTSGCDSGSSSSS